MNFSSASPDEFSLVDGSVHVWSADLNRSTAEVDEMYEWLSPDEQERSHRFISKSLTDSYVVSHAILREILGRYLNQDPASLVFEKTPHGKPYLNGQNLTFNMTHTQGVALYAIALQPVGIDIECLSRAVEVEEIAKRFFTPSEYQLLLMLPVEQRQQAFYRCWTRKEAFIKAMGEGLTYGLDKFEVDFMKDQNCLISIENSTAKAKEWDLMALNYSAEHTAALALKGAIKNLSAWGWSRAPASKFEQSS